jgi:hypothetical protein
MLLSDYIIDHHDYDWPTMLADWAWLLPAKLTVWIMNRYGDLFLVFDDETVHLFDVAAGTLTKIAENRDDSCNRIDDDDNANDWLMIPLVDQMTQAGKMLKPGQCYSLVISPMLGGEYSVANSIIVDVAKHYSFHASIHKQIKDLPEGTQVRLVVTNSKSSAGE